MSSQHVIGNEGSVEAQRNEHTDGFEVEAIPELHPSVEQEIQATVDYTNERVFDGRLFGQTLEAEERMRAREWEVERTRIRFDRRQDSDREARTREVVSSVERMYRETDPREGLSREELAAINREADRIAGRIDGFSRAAVSRRLARRIARGEELTWAVIEVAKELRTAPGAIVPIEAVGEVPRGEVSVEGEITRLWEPSHPSIQQVGLIGDGTAQIKFTIWRASRQPVVKEGDRVRFRDAAKNWYEGRCSIALTSWSRMVFPERDVYVD